MTTSGALAQAPAPAAPAQVTPGQVAPPLLMAPPPAAPQLGVEAAPPTVPPAPGAAVPPAALPSAPASVPELTRQLLDLELRARQIELDQSKIKLRGLKIAKYVTWSTSALMLLSALGSFAQAEAIKDAIDRGSDDKAYDVNGDKEVTKADERHERRLGLGLALTSLIPIGLGVWTTVWHAKRVQQLRQLGFQYEDITMKRRSILQRLGAEVGVAPSLASVQVKLAF